MKRRPTPRKRPVRPRRSSKNPPPASETLPRLAGMLRVPVDVLRDHYESLAGARVGATSEVGPVTMEVTLRGVTVSYRPPQGGSRVRVPLPLPRAPFGAGSPDELRPRPRDLGTDVFAPSFADKVETLARHIEAMQRAAITARFRAAGKPVPEGSLDSGELSTITIEPSRKYWYLRTKYGGRRYAVEVETGNVLPMDSRGPMAVGVPLNDLGAYDWAGRYYLPQKLAQPLDVRWIRSPLPSPKKAPAKAKSVPLRTADAGDFSDWSPRPRRGVRDERPSEDRRQGTEFRGSKYGQCKEEGSGGVKIAKCVRKDLAAAERDGSFPKGIEFSVRADYNHITVSVVRVPRVLVVNPEFVMAQRKDPNFSGGGYRGEPHVDRYTPTGRAILKEINGILTAYNRDDSDTMVDHSDVEFYTTVDFDSRLVNQQQSDILANARLAERVDHYLTDDLREAVKATWRAGPEAVYGPSGLRVRWIDNKRVLAEADVSSPQEAYEYALSWSQEFGKRKASKNGRRTPRRR